MVIIKLKKKVHWGRSMEDSVRVLSVLIDLLNLMIDIGRGQ